VMPEYQWAEFVERVSIGCDAFWAVGWP